MSDLINDQQCDELVDYRPTEQDLAEYAAYLDSQKRSVIWRIRLISCDGGQPGREWSSAFFLYECRALSHLTELIAKSDERNPMYPFKTEREEVGGVWGYCNWQFGMMYTMDAVDIK